MVGDTWVLLLSYPIFTRAPSKVVRGRDILDMTKINVLSSCFFRFFLFVFSSIAWVHLILKNGPVGAQRLGSSVESAKSSSCVRASIDLCHLCFTCLLVFCKLCSMNTVFITKDDLASYTAPLLGKIFTGKYVFVSRLLRHQALPPTSPLPGVVIIA